MKQKVTSSIRIDCSYMGLGAYFTLRRDVEKLNAIINRSENGESRNNNVDWFTNFC